MQNISGIAEPYRRVLAAMQSLSHWFKFRVQTLDKPRLTSASADLARIASAFGPDLLIGIRSGGYVVAQSMAPHFPLTTLLPITCRRTSTQKKQGSSALKNILRKLPDSVTGRLRIIEHILLTQLRPPKQSVFTPDAKELAAIENRLRELGGTPKILIVDDAVDSGATLAAVTDTLKKIAPSGAIIRTAVITVTTASPFVEPNYLLYRYVLCRFPWSLDFKN